MRDSGKVGRWKKKRTVCPGTRELEREVRICSTFWVNVMLFCRKYANYSGEERERER